ncbi:integrase catalytic domain-containing protein [Trichonephila clavata]|uniref:Integrase catalytic domain-containing protein n=1 Tax=Trichonephila clavata TaxID=2740835 RepID=A0A8X6LVV0_TRICU|nr:integrase catalytic domain-containing protein [Trichonephila clavata]
MAEFSKTYQTEDNRRVVSLPWKPTASTLPTNMANAKKRFDSLQKRLQSNDVLKKEYERGMLNYIEQEHIEIISDASSHDPGMPSLNVTLEVGPNLLPETVECLLRFRTHEFSITRDGQQAFLQLSLRKKG